MDPMSITILSLIISAFLLFAVALAYGDYATGFARRAKDAAAKEEWKADKKSPTREAA
jgi:hypothetical protein